MAITDSEETRARQLEVHGLPYEHLECSPGGPQEKALNHLLTKLGTENVDDRGIDITQEHIVGACAVKQTSKSEKSQVLILTVNSKETKEKIIRAAYLTKTHSRRKQSLPQGCHIGEEHPEKKEDTLKRGQECVQKSST